MMWQIVCDTRDRFPNAVENMSYNDHPPYGNLQEFVSSIHSLGFDCQYFGGVPELISAIESNTQFSQCVFLNFSDGLELNYARVQVPLLCEMLGVLYSGSDVFSSALQNNKNCSCSVVREAGFSAPKGFRVTRNIKPHINDLSNLMPVFVKPNTEGSSVGVVEDSLQCNETQALEYINQKLNVFDELVVEEYIQGTDVTVFIIGNIGLGMKCVEPIALFSDKQFLDVDVKSNHLMQRISYSNIATKRQVDAICETAVSIFELLECRDVARMDFRVTKDGEIFFIESNSCPRFSNTSEIGFIANEHGTSFDSYVRMLLETIEVRIDQS